MDLVLGLSMTLHGIRWVLVEGTTGAGAPVGSGVLDVPDLPAFDADAFLEDLLGDAVLHSAGLTWTPEAKPLAAKMRAAFSVVGGGARIVDVSDVTAVEVLSRGIGEITGHDFVAVVLSEPSTALVATVDWQRVTVERVGSSEFASRVNGISALIGDIRPRPEAIFVVGSRDTETIARVLRDDTHREVVTASAADFALTRGTALAAAQTPDVGDTAGKDPRGSQVRLLSSVLAAAVVVFVVAVSLAAGLRLTPKSNEPTSATSAERHVAPIDEAALRLPAKAPEAAPAKAPEAAPAAAPPPAPAVAPEPPAVIEHRFSAPVPEVAEPQYVPPPAEPVAPAPVFVPPPAPVYVPPPPPPRLRDRIIDKIPLIRRLPH